MAKFDRFIQNKILRISRLKEIAKVVNKLPGKTILDIGCMDLALKNKLSGRFKYQGIDPEPLEKSPLIKEIPIEELGNEKYDIIVCTEVLEHLHNPVKAIEKIKSIARKYILISVPNEPFFALFRLFIPASEHLWTIFPQTLKKHLGKPALEKKICFNRHYLALWDVSRLQ